MSGFLREGFFHYGRAVAKGAVAEVADGGLDARGEFLEAGAHEFVVVAPEGVAGDVAARGVLQGARGLDEGLWEVVHAGGEDADGAGMELRGAGAFGAVAVHIAHFAVEVAR